MSELLRKMIGNVLMEQAGAEGGAGGGGQGSEKSLMESAAAGELEASGKSDDKGEAGEQAASPEARAAQASEKDIRRPKSVPAKFWNAETGEVNFEAWSKSTTELENRMKDVGLPPKTAEEYTFEAPKEFKEAGLDLDPAMTKEFREAALAAGLTQKQYEFVMGKYFASVGSMVEAAEGFGREGCRKDLMAFYKTEEAMGDALKSAFNTFAAYADEEEMGAINRIGNNPYFIRVLAKINRELTEDKQIDTGGMVSEESIEELMAKGSPYWDASHPQHKRVVDKVTAYHQRKTRDSQRKRAA